MARELEDAEDTKYPERDERAAEVFVVADAETDVVRQDGDYVDDAHHRTDVATPRRRRVQSQQILNSEDYDAGRVQTKQFDAVAFAARLDAAESGRCRPTRNSLDHVRGDGQCDEEAGDVIENERGRAGLRILERFP